MKTPCQILLASGLALGLTAADAAVGGSLAADPAVRMYFKAPALQQRGAAPLADTTATVQTPPAPASAASPSAAATHARAARARFDEARAAMDRALLRREAQATATVAALQTAIGDLSYHLGYVEGAVRSSESIGKAKTLVQNWYEAGLKVISPPPGGVIELPMPTYLKAKAEAAAAMLDQVTADASAAASRPASPVKKRASAPAPAPTATKNNVAAAPNVTW